MSGLSKKFLWISWSYLLKTRVVIGPRTQPNIFVIQVKKTIDVKKKHNRKTTKNKSQVKYL